MNLLQGILIHLLDHPQLWGFVAMFFCFGIALGLKSVRLYNGSLNILFAIPVVAALTVAVARIGYEMAGFIDQHGYFGRGGVALLAILAMFIGLLSLPRKDQRQPR